MSASAPTICPSAACRPGAVLIGIVLPNGRIAYAADRIVIDSEFVRIAHEGRPPEQRFRFGSACMGSRCQQWDGGQCGLIDRLLDDYKAQFGHELDAPDPLPQCAVRADCRWFRQRGGACCRVCDLLVTDVGVADADLPREVRVLRRGLSPA